MNYFDITLGFQTCEQKEAVLRRENYQVMNLSLTRSDYFEANCVIEVRNGQEWISCMGTRRFK